MEKYFYPVRRDRTPKEHTLHRILWPEIPQDHSPDPITIKIPTALPKLEAYYQASKEANTFLTQAFNFYKRVLNVNSAKETITAPPWEDKHIAAYLKIGRFKRPQINLVNTYYYTAVAYTAELLMGKHQPEDLSEFKLNALGILQAPYAVKAGYFWALLATSVTHELYHARQYLQDPVYYKQTANENYYANQCSMLSQTKDDYWHQRSNRIYYNCQGERGARGFEIRALNEYTQALATIPDSRRTLTEKLYLTGAGILKQANLQFIIDTYHQPPKQNQEK